MPLSALRLHAALALPPQAKRDLTVALVGFTSWAAVAWKLSRVNSTYALPTEALLALGASLLCLWPILLGLWLPAAYTSWREWLVPAHLAAQHWIGLHFALPQDGQQLLLETPGWAQSMLPIFLATFSQPWLYLAFGVCLQRTRLRTFLWTQPLLLAPMLWGGRTHCGGQLAATPKAAAHLQRIAGMLQHCTSWLPVAPLSPTSGISISSSSSSGSSGGVGAGEPTGDADAASACLSVHVWLMLMLAYCLPAIVMHRLEGQEEHAQRRERKRWQPRQAAAAEAAPLGGDSRGAYASAAGREPQRDLLLQRHESLLDSAAELLLAGYSAWLLVQLAAPLLG